MMIQRRIGLIGLAVLLSLFLGLSNLGASPAYARTLLPPTDENVEEQSSTANSNASNDVSNNVKNIDASALPRQLFIPAIAGNMDNSLEAFAKASSTDSEVEMCFNSTAEGRQVSGVMPDASSVNLWGGVFNVTVNGHTKKAFCTDFHNSISTGCYSNSTIGATDPLVACALQYYPPQAGLSNDEAAARQSTIWHFSDGLNLTGPSEVKTLYDQYVAFVMEKNEAGLCEPVVIPSLTIDPPLAVNFLESDGNGGFLSSPHEYTIQLMKGSMPVANEAITVTTDLGTLSAGALNGTTLYLTTDANGQATVTVTYNQPGSATITVNANVQLPTGTRIDPAPNRQKLVISEIENFELVATAIKQWEPEAKVVVKKFHDRDRNGLFNTPPDELIDWQIAYRQTDGDDFGTGFDPSDGWTTVWLGADGIESLDVELGKNYQFCEITQDGWAATTPVCFSGVTAGNTVSFGNVELPALVITKYHDLNANGVRDEGEPGLVGWQFSVRRYQNNSWGSTYSGQTNADGHLGLTDMIYPFEYQATEAMQSGWYSTTSTVQTVAITGQGLFSLVFGNVQPGSLTINKNWFANNSQTTSDEATFCLQRVPAAPAHAPVPTIGGTPLTLTEGKYCTTVENSATVNNLWPGAYIISESPLAGWNISVASQDVTIVGGQTETVTFRNDKQIPGITIKKYTNDEDADTPTGPVVAVGSTVTWTYVVTNAGNVPLSNVVVTDNIAGVTPVYVSGDVNNNNLLDLTETWLFRATGIAIVGQYANTGYVKGTPPTGPDVKDDDPSHYFGEKPTELPASLGDRVWIDANQNGKQDPGEANVPGVEVTLYTCEGMQVGTPLVTDANGEYLFTDLDAGCYYVVFNPATLPDGYVFTEQHSNGVPSNSDSDANPNTGKTQSVTLAPGDAYLDLDAGIYKPAPTELPASLGDRVWIDANQNGKQDPGEANVPGVEVTLYTCEGMQVGTPLVTDANGEYLFTDLDAGCYYVVFNPATLPDGYVFTEQHSNGVPSNSDSDANPNTGKTQSVTLAPGDAYLDLDAGIYKPTQPILSALGDTVWFDANKNGLQDSGEPGVPGVEVRLYKADGTFVASQETNANGKYLFINLEAGSYYVEFATVEGYNFTRHNVGGNSNDALDSDPKVPWVEVGISDGGNEGELGKPLTYTFFYTNTDATLNATNVVISTTIPAGTTFVPGSSDARWVCTQMTSGSVCSLTLANLPANSKGSATFTVLLSDSTSQVPSALDIVATLTQGTLARTDVVTLAPGETNLTVDAGLVIIESHLTTPTFTDPTSLPGIGQPSQKMQIFLPAVQSSVTR